MVHTKKKKKKGNGFIEELACLKIGCDGDVLFF